MKLALIYNLWDDWDLFRMSYQRTAHWADGVIVVASERSNFGEVSEIPDFMGRPITLLQKEPHFREARENETAKRNYGLQAAREMGFTHFLMMDADEFYEPEEFLKEKKRIEEQDYIHFKPLSINCSS